MEKDTGSLRLRRVRKARGLADLDRIPLRQRPRQAGAATGALSSPDSPGSSPGSASGAESDDERETPSPPPPPPNAALAPPVVAPPAVPATQVIPPTITRRPLLVPAQTQAQQPAETPGTPVTPATPTTILALLPVLATTTLSPPNSPTTLPPPIANPQQSEGLSPPAPPPPPSAETTTTPVIRPTTLVTSSLPAGTISATPITPTSTSQLATSVPSSLSLPTNSGSSATTSKATLPTDVQPSPSTTLPGGSSGGSLPTGPLGQASGVSSVIPEAGVPSGTALPAAGISDEGGSAGRKAGIAVGTIAGVGLLVAILFFLFRRHKQRQNRYLEKPYTQESARNGRPPTVFRAIQDTFQRFNLPSVGRPSYFSGSFWRGDRASTSAPPLRAAAVANRDNRGNGTDVRSQSQILNELFQAAYAAEDGVLSNRNSATTGNYYVDEKAAYRMTTEAGGTPSEPPLFLPAEEVEQPGLRGSIGRWLRGHHPLRMNPLAEKSGSSATSSSFFSSSVSRPSSFATSAAGRSSAVPSTFRSLSPLPPVPMLPAVAMAGQGQQQQQGMMSRWSESTRQTPPSPSDIRTSSAVGSDTRVSSLFSLYRQRDTQGTMASMYAAKQQQQQLRDSDLPPVPPQVPGEQWWRVSSAASSDGSWTTGDLLARESGGVAGGGGGVGVETSGAGGPAGRSRVSSNALSPSRLPSALPTPVSTVRLSIKQPIPAALAHMDIASRLEGTDRTSSLAGDGGDVVGTGWPFARPGT